MTKHLNIKIHGSVQGVCFREYAKKKADELGVCGLVRNENDGTVQIEAEGDNDSLQKLVDWCQHGPSYARVEKIDVEEGSMEGFESFEVLFV